ncbi:MAG: dienelactone hydrolase family protein [Burkholderiaceae bacterium]|nr:dienelactone hydrolase family protein [Burkholderiaceae bacterium]
MSPFHCSLQVALALSFAAFSPGAMGQQVKTEVLVPNTGKGAIAVVLSSNFGPSAQRDFAQQLAAAGYYVVLADGRDFLIALGGGDFRGANGASELRRIVSDAQSAAQARPGKAAVVGFAIGGGAALKHAASTPDDIAAAVVLYPNLKPLGSDVPGLAAQFRVPVLVLAAERDAVCCHAGTMQLLASTPKQAPFEFVSFPDSGHAFDVKATPGYMLADAQAATKKAIEFLLRVHPPAGQ